MGAVFEALDVALGRRVAPKVIAPDLAQDVEFRARFTAEARALAGLDSPHVVPVFTHGEQAGRLYIATQLMPGGDLAHLIEAHGALPLRPGLDLIGQVAAGPGRLPHDRDRPPRRQACQHLPDAPFRWHVVVPRRLRRRVPSGVGRAPGRRHDLNTDLDGPGSARRRAGRDDRRRLLPGLRPVGDADRPGAVRRHDRGPDRCGPPGAADTAADRWHHDGAGGQPDPAASDGQGPRPATPVSGRAPRRPAAGSLDTGRRAEAGCGPEARVGCGRRDGGRLDRLRDVEHARRGRADPGR
jgi:hypothetical protein